MLTEGTTPDTRGKNISFALWIHRTAGNRQKDKMLGFMSVYFYPRRGC